MGDGRAVGIGWPMSPIHRLGGLLRRVDGFLVFWRVGGGEKPNDAPVSHGSSRRTAVGWPRATLLSDGTAPREAGLDGTESDDERPTGPSQSEFARSRTATKESNSDPRASTRAAPDEPLPPAINAAEAVPGEPGGDAQGSAGEAAEGAHPSERDGADMVRDSDDGPGYGDPDSSVSRET